MKLTQLKSLLETVTNSAVKQVAFDLSLFLSEEHEKGYPLIFWDFDNSKWLHQTEQKATITISVFVLGIHDDWDGDKFATWDYLEGALKDYLNKDINTSTNTIAVEVNNIQKEYFPAGLMSVDNELAVKYDTKIYVYC